MKKMMKVLRDISLYWTDPKSREILVWKNIQKNQPQPVLKLSDSTVTSFMLVHINIFQPFFLIKSYLANIHVDASNLLEDEFITQHFIQLNNSSCSALSRAISFQDTLCFSFLYWAAEQQKNVCRFGQQQHVSISHGSNCRVLWVCVCVCTRVVDGEGWRQIVFETH